MVVALTVSLVIFALLGLGFAISGLAKTDSQAVQYSMVVCSFRSSSPALSYRSTSSPCRSAGLLSGARHVRDQRAP